MKKIWVLLLAVGLIFSFTGCPVDDKGDGGGDGINWTNDANGTLTVLNNTNKDMVIFVGNSPTPNTIYGGVRAMSTRVFDVSGKVSDFGVGGFLVLRGVTLDEYNATKNNPSLARIEYSAMATYGQGKNFRTEINPNYIGDYGYELSNIGRVGIELRKDSPEGEKIGYLPALAAPTLYYANSSNRFTAYPVYVYFQRSTGTVTTLRPTSSWDALLISPRELNNPTQMQSYRFPADQTVTWESIINSLASPVAYVSITNNLTRDVEVRVAGTNRLLSQNGYDSLPSGRTQTYEIEASVTGTQRALGFLVANILDVPVKVSDAIPTFKNGYDYNITVSAGGNGQQVSDYTVTFTESAIPRDLSSDIGSL